MKYILLFVLLAPHVHAQKPERDAAFAKQKEAILQSLDRTISMFQEQKKCIADAKNHEALRLCHEKMRGERMKHMGKGMKPGPGGPGKGNMSHPPISPTGTPDPLMSDEK